MTELNTELEKYESLVDFFLFDTFDKEQHGGTGEAFNWHLLDDLETETPYFLAGGIGTDNLKKAVRDVNPYAVDVSSSLEEEKGVKDFELMADFMEEVREVWDTQNDD